MNGEGVTERIGEVRKLLLEYMHQGLTMNDVGKVVGAVKRFHGKDDMAAPALPNSVLNRNLHE